MIKRILNVLIILVMGIAAYASDIYEDAGTSSIQFLKLGIGARPVSMGSSYCAVADDTFGIFWNPAGASKMQTTEYGFMYNSWLSNISQEVVTATLPLRQKETVSLGIIYLHMPNLQSSDIYGNETGSFIAYDMLASVSYSSRFSRNGLRWGVTGKFYEEGIEKEKASGYCFDAGLLYNPDGAKLSLGMAVQNLGPEAKFVKDSFSLPRNFKAGASYLFLEDTLLMASDINKAVDEKLGYGLGFEYSRYKPFSARIGWQSKGGVTAGLGAVVKSIYIFDYAFAPYEDLGTNHLLTLKIKFDDFRKEKAEEPAEQRYAALQQAATTFIYGMVINENGVPVQEAVVKISAGDDEIARAYTEYDGSYQTPELPEGKYELKAWKFRYEADSQVVKLSGSDPKEADFTIISEKSSNFAYGKVSDPKGNPIQGAIVEFVQNGKEVAHGATNIDGKFVVSELPFGLYEVKSWIGSGALAKPKKCKISKSKPTYIELIIK